jgi:hypothetical protein
MTEEIKKTNTEKKGKWSLFYKNWKSSWRNPNISIYSKAILFNIFLYRSDGEGWYISERKMAKDLGISKETASKAIDDLLKRGFILGHRKERKRGKLRLSGFLRSPDWITSKPNDWTTEKPSKYQSKYQINNNLDFSNKRNGTMEKVLTGDELHKLIQKSKESNRI